MPKTESFDVSTGVDLMEIDNAVNQARKEISTRFDFKGSVAEIDFDRKTSKLGLHASDDYKLEAVCQAVDITQAIDQDTARKLVRFLKEGKYKKVQTAIQGSEVRVSAPSRDELQGVIQDLKGENWGMELKFGNYR